MPKQQFNLNDKEKEQAKQYQKLSDYFYKELQPIANRLEPDRKRARSRQRFRFNLNIAKKLTSLRINLGFIGVIIALLFSPITLLIEHIRRNIEERSTDDPVQYYNIEYKFQIVAPMISHQFPDIFYRPTSGIPHYIYRKSGLNLGNFNRFIASDRITGRIKNIKFDLSMVAAFFDSDVAGSIQVDIHEFPTRGIFIVTQSNKRFRGSTYIYPEKLSIEQNNETFFAETFSEKGSRALLEDTEFEDYFRVYSSCQQEARYLITPKLMRQLVKTDQSISNGHLCLSFHKNQLYIFIRWTKDKFLAPNINEASSSFIQLRKIYSELVSILRIIEDLDLERNIWQR